MPENIHKGTQTIWQRHTGEDRHIGDTEVQMKTINNNTQGVKRPQIKHKQEVRQAIKI